jgi:hypothetical protein
MRNNPIIKFIIKYKALIIILALVTVLRIPSLFEPNHYADEDIYLTLGMGLRKGLVFYRDIHDNKPPLLYLTAAIAGNITNFKVILLFWNSVSVVLVWFLTQKFFKSINLVKIITLIFGIFSTIPLLEGNFANGEIFMIMPVIAAVLVLFSQKPNFFLAGLLFSIGLLFKVPILFEFLGILFWLTFYQSKTIFLGIKKLFSKNCLLLIFGFILPIFCTLVYYFMVGAGSTYLKAAFFQNVGYLSSWENKAPFYQSGMFIRTIILLISFCFIYFSRRKYNPNFGFIALWFLSALFGALLSGRPYPPYLVEIILPACLVLASLISETKFYSKITSFILLVLLIFSVFYFKFWHYRTLNYYQNFIKYQLKIINKNQYLSFFGDNVINDQKISEYIQKSTSKDDKIFIWGTEPAIYVLSNRLPIGKYTVAYHISDFNGFNETIDRLKITLPKIIIYYPDQPSFFKLDTFIKNYYFVTKVIGNATIYQLR